MIYTHLSNIMVLPYIHFPHLSLFKVLIQRITLKKVFKCLHLPVFISYGNNQTFNNLFSESYVVTITNKNMKNHTHCSKFYRTMLGFIWYVKL